MDSCGLHLGLLRNSGPLSELHLPWPPMVSTTEISVCFCLFPPWTPMVSTLAFSETLGLYQNSTSYFLLWSQPLRSQFACACLSPPPPMDSYGLHLGILRNSGPLSELHLPWPPMVSTTNISVCLCLSLTSTSHGLPWSPPWHSQKLCAFIRPPPPMASYGLYH